MPEFCDVALPVPLDTAFTYRLPDGMQPVVGGRVLVPFRQQRLSGVVTALHDRAPKVQTKNISAYSTPRPYSMSNCSAGQVDCGLLSGAARRSLSHHAAAGRGVQTNHRLPHHRARTDGAAPRRNGRRISPRPQDARRSTGGVSRPRLPGERETVREESLRAATRVSKSVLAGMVRKQWIAREDLSDVRDATRTMKVALLKSRRGQTQFQSASVDRNFGRSGREDRR